MKKLMALFIICACFMTACGSGNISATPAETANPAVAASSAAKDDAGSQNVSAVSSDIVEIKDKMFLTQVTDVYTNPNDYMGKTIKYEGIFDIFEIPEKSLKYYSVIRYGPGCCGDDGNVGFEVKWDGEYPKQNDWVEATGVLEEYKEGSYMYLRIALSSLNVLDVRGEENVIQ